MTLTWTGFRFELIASRMDPAFDYSAIVLAGFRRDATCYWTGLVESARKFEKYADESARSVFDAANNQIAASLAMTSNLIIPSPKNLAYMGFQKAGAEYILGRPNTLLADEMGTGKSIIMTGVVNADPSIKNILCICPAGLRIWWGRTFQKWLIRKLSGAYAQTGLNNTLPDTNIVIINYDIIAKFREAIDTRLWDLLICDEAHYLKNFGAKRTVAVMGEDSQYPKLGPIQAKRSAYLTGTPILNRPYELWPIAKKCDPTDLGVDAALFGKRYCGGKLEFGEWDFSGASNLGELQTKLRSKFMIRRMKKDVLSELPPKFRQIIPIPNPGIKAVKEENDFYNNNVEMAVIAKQLAETAQLEGDDDTYKIAARSLRSTQKLAFEQMSKLRHATAVAKIPFANQFIIDALEQQPKVVVFAHHRDVIEAIYSKFSSIAVMIHGGVAIDKRQDLVDRFQEDSSIKLCVSSMTAGGVGFTMTAANYVMFVELDWVPAIMKQAEDRLHRFGQKKNVLVQHIVFDQSLDATMAKRIIEKIEIIEAAVG